MIMTITILVWVQVGEMTKEMYQNLRIGSSIVILLIGFKFFEWLKLFDRTSFYIKLLLATLYDITSFILLFFASLYTFGMAIYFIA